jgi:hypothetical protein
MAWVNTNELIKKCEEFILNNSQLKLSKLKCGKFEVLNPLQ